MLLHLFALAASVAAATEVSVVWRHEKPSANTSLTVYSAADKNTVMAEACGNTIGSLDFSRLDEHGGGNFTVGDGVFDVFSETVDGAPGCTRMFNDLIAVVECSGVQFDVPVGVPQSADCFSVEHAKHTFDRLKTRSVDKRNATKDTEHVAGQGELKPSRLSRILGSAMSRIAGRIQKRATETIKVGDGNPHQNYLHKQLSENIRCGTADSCGVDYTQTESLSIGFSTEIAPGAGALKGWTKAGFTVQKAWVTGNNFKCGGGGWRHDVHLVQHCAHNLHSPRIYRHIRLLADDRRGYHEIS